MTLSALKLFFRTVIKVVAGGPPVGTPGANRAAGVLQALDQLAEFAQALADGSATLYAFTGTTQAPQAVVQGAFYYLPGQVLAKRVGASGDATALDPSDTANWETVVAVPVLPALRDIYDVPEAVRNTVAAGNYGASGPDYAELQDPTPAGSLPGYRFKQGQALYEYMRGSLGNLVWVRSPAG